jgi:signal transduction histidine kinase
MFPIRFFDATSGDLTMTHSALPNDPINGPNGGERDQAVQVADAAAAERYGPERYARLRLQPDALGEITGGIVHDFRNVLTIVESNLRLAERHSDEPDKVLVYIAGAREVVTHAVKLTSRLLAFAKHQEVDPQPGDANACLENLELLLKFGAGPAVRISLVLAPDIPKCLIDPSQFNAAMLNLVINARDAMPDGGDVEISTTRWPAETTGADPLASDAYVLVRVKDNGGGISPDVAHRIFDPFFTTKGDRGTGLGLPQVCAFMQRIGGQVRVASERGVGTVVDLLLPTAGSGPIATPGRGAACDTPQRSFDVSRAP